MYSVTIDEHMSSLHLNMDRYYIADLGFMFINHWSHDLNVYIIEITINSLNDIYDIDILEFIISHDVMFLKDKEYLYSVLDNHHLLYELLFMIDRNAEALSKMIAGVEYDIISLEYVTGTAFGIMLSTVD